MVGAGSLASTTSDIATKTLLGDSSQTFVKRLGLYSTHNQDIDAVSDSVTVGIASGKGAFADNEVTSKANISIGTNATVLADQIDIKGNNYLVKN